MDLATGAMGSLLPKLVELLNDEYKLQKGVKEGVQSLEKEMKSMHAALRKVAEVPRDQLDEQVKVWAGEVRELSFDMEDVIDKFLVRVDDESEPATKSNKLKRLTEKMVGLFTKGKARHEIADAIKDINKQVQEVANRRGRYNIDNIVATNAPMTAIDPRLKALYTEVTDLVGIAGKRDQELINLLLDRDSMLKKKVKMVSVVGFGGLGKTTLVKTVYDKIKGEFDCRAFVPVGRNADAKKVFMDILVDLGMYGSELIMLDERQLIDKLRESLKKKRYLIVIDDIWDEKLWKIINLAFSRSSNFASRLVTTTRIVSVSKLCCSSTDDSVYQMRPLSDDDSKRLFYKRTFFHEGGCPHEFEEVSIDILKKCGGVPLAIITIASLLASDQRVKPEDEWHVLLDSIGRGLTEDPSVEEMLRILSFSYYDLPSYLKTCLLYLSMFPEDSVVKKDRLIWMWIAESFVQRGKEKTSLFEIGETYFNELVNRNMIQPIYDDEDKIGQVDSCRVHDMVLDLISSLSSEGNFVTIVNGAGNNMCSERKVRRMSLQNVRKEEVQTTPLRYMGILQVRSIAAFERGIDLMPPFLSFGVLRVLDLTGCNLDHLNLRDLGSLFHLRYLSLAQTSTPELPEEVGELQFLEVLDLRGNYNRELPSTIFKLRRLICLLIDWGHRWSLPDGLRNLSSLEVLSEIHCDSLSIVKELGNMEKMRKLGVRFGNLSLEGQEVFVESLAKQSSLQSLEINFLFDHDQWTSLDILGERWAPPRGLQEFVTDRYVGFSTLPAWINQNPPHLCQLSKLCIAVDEVRQEDLDIFGRLPVLHCLLLWSKCQSRLLLVGTNGFRCLASFELLFDTPGKIMFQPGALPKAEKVKLAIGLQATKEESAVNGGDCFDLGMGNLLSLRNVIIWLHHSVTFEEAHDKAPAVAEANQAVAALENAFRAHPSRPTFDVSLTPEIPEFGVPVGWWPDLHTSAEDDYADFFGPTYLHLEDDYEDCFGGPTNFFP